MRGWGEEADATVGERKEKNGEEKGRKINLKTNVCLMSTITTVVQIDVSQEISAKEIYVYENLRP